MEQNFVTVTLCIEKLAPSLLNFSIMITAMAAMVWRCILLRIMLMFTLTTERLRFASQFCKDSAVKWKG